MNVTVISHLYPNRSFPAKGTFVRSQYRNIARRLPAQMIVPSVYSIPFTDKWKYTHAPFLTDQEATRVRYLSFPGGMFPRIIKSSLSRTLVSQMSEIDPGLAHIHWLFPDGLAIPALKAQMLPCVLTIHGSDWYATRDIPVLKQLLRESLVQTDAVLTVGQKLKTDILRDYPDLEEKTHVTYNPVDFDAFHPVTSREEALAKLGWQPDVKHILCVANITPVKGVDILIDAFKKLDREDAILHIIGNVPDMAYSRQVTREIRTTRNIKLHAPVSHEEIVTYYQACDFLVLPSRREGFGLSLAEAIACGKPVISTKSGGPEDIVRPENGYLVEPEYVDALADKMDLLLSDRFGHSSTEIRDSIRELFDSKAITDKTIALYKTILNNQSHL